MLSGQNEASRGETPIPDYRTQVVVKKRSVVGRCTKAQRALGARLGTATPRSLREKLNYRPRWEYYDLYRAGPPALWVWLGPPYQP